MTNLRMVCEINIKVRMRAVFRIVVFLFVYSIFYILYSGAVQAAQLYFEPGTLELAPSEQFKINLFMDTQGEDINAIAATLSYPLDALNLVKIQEGGSILNFWVEKPKERKGGELNFSGITPGGFNGASGFILSVFFEVKNFQSGSIKLKDTATHLNDGEGTQTNIFLSDFQFFIDENKLEVPEQEEVNDLEAPESFTLQIVKDPNLFGNKNVLIFAAQDKHPGIDYYEVAEVQDTFWQKFISQDKVWVRGQSPYLLSNQNLNSYIYVKAVDKVGNERIESLNPAKPYLFYKDIFIQFAFIVVVLIVVLVVLLVVLIRHRKKQEI